MPAINAQLLTDVARQRFQALQLPAGADRNRYQTYISDMCNAILQALQQWRTSARLEGVRINGPVAIGGKLVADRLEPLILARAPAGWDAYTRAVAAGVHNQLSQFANEVSVPGLPWYPAFAAWPGPVAPPTPNVPTPLMALSAVACRNMKEGALTSAIFDKMPNPKPPCGKEVAIALAAGLEKALLAWLSAQKVMMVMGKGRVPTFAPPYVPVGPVVMGDNISTPGHIGS